jgi:hypothetical protein
MTTKPTTPTKPVTLDDVMNAVTGVGHQVKTLAVTVEAIDKRVTVLEQQPPILKTRMVGVGNGNGNGLVNQGPYGNGNIIKEKPKAIPREVVTPSYHDDGGGDEDEALASGAWAKVIKTNRCNRVSLTKTRKRDCWKMILSLPGRSRPATFIGWDGPEQILMMFADVMPELSLDDFDQATWAKKDKGQERPPLLKQWDVNFTVEWFQTAPTGHNGATFISVETVYPLYEE